ncbi:MAG TPA: VOC family protein [Microvirga sp.]|nr:VOC family protein [Microvirga sp.]
MRPLIEGIGQIALPVTDPDRSQTFYGETLGLSLLYRFGSLVFFSTGNLRLMLSGGEEKPIAPSSSCIYFRVPDIDRAHARLRSRGVVFQDEPHLIARMPDHELWMAFFRDPDGHLLALMAEKR